MDFSSQLTSHIDRKRKAAQTRAAKLRKKPDPERDLERELLASIPPETLEKTLVAWEAPPAASKAEQLRTLHVIVAQQQREQRYEAFLAEEASVGPSIEFESINAGNARRLALQVRRFIKEILAVWLEEPRPPYTLLLLHETKLDLVKLMYKLRAGTLPVAMVVSLATIVYHVQHSDFQHASESYMVLSIGNVAYPIGVSDVGIHARSADCKISGDDRSQLANIMKSERTRRWILSVKRLVSFCQVMQGGSPSG